MSWRCCGWWSIPPVVRPRCGCSPVRAGGSGRETSPPCGSGPPNLTSRVPASTAPQRGSSPRSPPTPIPPAWPMRSAIPGPRNGTHPWGMRASSRWAANCPFYVHIWAIRCQIWWPRSGGFSVSTPRPGPPARRPRGGAAPNTWTPSVMWWPSSPSAPTAHRPACWPIWTLLPISRTGSLRPRWLSPPTGSRSSPCTPPRAWNGISSRYRT